MNKSKRPLHGEQTVTRRTLMIGVLGATAGLASRVQAKAEAFAPPFAELGKKKRVSGPKFAMGILAEHAEIKMTARDGSYFGLPKDPSARHDSEISLDFFDKWVGPDMSWKGETHGNANTRATLDVVLQSATSYKATLKIDNKVGGGCGPGGHGGWGRAAPEYHSSFDVPAAVEHVNWTIRFVVHTDFEGVSGGVDGRDVGNCTLEITNPDLTKRTFVFSRKDDKTFQISPASTGLYSLALFGSEVARGCLGAAPGTQAQGTASIKVGIEIFAVSSPTA